MQSAWWLDVRHPGIYHRAMSPRRAWYTYKRSAGKKRATYEGAFLDPTTGRYRRQALRTQDGSPCTNKAAADEAAALIASAAKEIRIPVSDAQLAEISSAAGKQDPGAYLLALHDSRQEAARGELLVDYLSSFWAMGSSYLRGKVARGTPLSAIYAMNSRSAIARYVRPWLDAHAPGLTLRAMTAAHLEDLTLQLREKLGASRVNGIVKAVRVALGEAYRLGLIADNPARRVRRLPDPAPRRQVLSMEEARRFFAQEWRDPRHKGANLTAALAGLRLGEIRGLQAQDIRGGYLHVCHNWQDTEGEGRQMKGPKHSTTIRSKDRDVPVPPSLEKALRDLATANPHADGFVFFGDRPGAPPSGEIIGRHFHEMLEKIGISRGEQMRRRLTFHAWRHWYNTHMRALVPEYQLRLLTGHTSEQMTDRYTEITPEQRAAIGQVAGKLLG